MEMEIGIRRERRMYRQTHHNAMNNYDRRVVYTLQFRVSDYGVLCVCVYVVVVVVVVLSLSLSLCVCVCVCVSVSVCLSLNVFFSLTLSLTHSLSLSLSSFHSALGDDGSHFPIACLKLRQGAELWVDRAVGCALVFAFSIDRHGRGDDEFAHPVFAVGQ